ncbi:major facilitator superfamily domain-containing protein [Polychytrium aggregatum]|uniref:major facilitator superfamily domain-containing protein n=1 Tax=Polychytrium aggregatum TaxID=110093 RepID=UPI0022FE8C9A|nr:major facilitator superfamily domain-containing protein [Polychytrium aggregatum]KAI9207705.1 major facilitator superfamily domain-containing protein [Polychytrium aggregatum]
MTITKVAITDVDNTTEVVKVADLDETTVEQPNVPVSRLVFIGIMVSLSLLIFAASMVGTIVATALPSIAHELGDLKDYSWVATAYLLTSTAIQPLSGVMSDIFGRKMVVVFSASAFLLGNILSAVSTSMIMLIVSRAVMGIGGGIIFSIVYVVIGDIVVPRKRGAYQGILGGVFSIATVMGPIIGGLFIDSSAGWRWCFYVIIPIAAISLISTIFLMKFPKPTGSLKDKLVLLDIWGTLTICVSVVLILLALTWGGVTYAWNSATIIVLFVVGGLMMGVFVLVEAKIPRIPIIPLDLFQYLNLNAGNIVVFSYGFQMFGFIFFVPLYFQAIHGKTAVQAGLALVPFVLAVSISSIIAGLVTSRFGTTRGLIIPSTALLSISVGLLILLDENSSWAVEATILALIGFAMGLGLQTVTAAVQGSVPVERLASATSSNTFFRTFGGVFGVALFQTVLLTRFQASLVTRLGPRVVQSVAISFDPNDLNTLPAPIRAVVVSALVDGFHTVWIVAASVAGAGFLASLLMRSVDWSKSQSHVKGAQRSPSLNNKVDDNA